MSTGDVEALVRNFDGMVSNLTNWLQETYVNHQQSEGESGWILHYYEFGIRIESINQFRITDLSNEDHPEIVLTQDCIGVFYSCYLELACTVFCFTVTCEYMYTEYDENLFESMMAVKIMEYIDSSNENIHFSVQDIIFPLLSDPAAKGLQRSEQYEFWIIVAVGILLIGALSFMCSRDCAYCKKKVIISRKRLRIQSPLVLLIAIGDYNSNHDDGSTVNPNRVVRNMTELFHTRINYDIYPKLNVDERPRIILDGIDLQKFIEEKAEYLKNNIRGGKMYDGLIAIISCRGTADHIISSDYQKYSKSAIQHTFSYWPVLREIPRFILFDCYSGNNIHGSNQLKDLSDESEHKYSIDQYQNFDHLIARVEATNLNHASGSSLIFKMYTKCMRALDIGQKRPFIHEIFDEVETELQNEGLQAPECIWNDGTRHLVLMKNKRNASNDRAVDGDQKQSEAEMDIKGIEILDKAADGVQTVYGYDDDDSIQIETEEVDESWDKGDIQIMEMIMAESIKANDSNDDQFPDPEIKHNHI